MRARFVNEKFTKDGDPIKDMGIGYKKRVLNSKAWKILEFIKSKGEEGASLIEIQHYIFVVLNGNSEEDFWKKTDKWMYNPRTGQSYKTKARATRGYWNTNLYGTTYPFYSDEGNPGLLHKYCKKNPKTKKWVFVRFPEPGEKIFSN